MLQLTKLPRLVLVVLGLGLSTGCERENSKLTQEIPWGWSGSWMIVDSHTHTTFSDGKNSVAEVVGFAVENGCEALAITDHSDLQLASATPEYFEALRRARMSTPNLVLIGGLEWNIPPYKGREHVTVLVRPDLEEASLTTLKTVFEKDAQISDALRWLEERFPAAGQAVLFYNHPSRKVDEITENASDMLRWQQGSRLFAGFEGAPGHQKLQATGAYKMNFLTDDRWDPVVSQVSGVWDALLDAGHEVWGALAVSDFHNDLMDYRPCEFARTHVQVPARTAEGVIKGLRAGSFWADHGRILDQMRLGVSAPGIELPVLPGEVAFIVQGQPVRWSLQIARGIGARGDPLGVEIISNCQTGKPKVIVSESLSPGEIYADGELKDLKPGIDRASCFLRARLRKNIADGPDLMAYTNAVRLQLVAGDSQAPSVIDEMRKWVEALAQKETSTPVRADSTSVAPAKPAGVETLDPAVSSKAEARKRAARERTSQALEKEITRARTRSDELSERLQRTLGQRLAKPRSRAEKFLSELEAAETARDGPNPMLPREAIAEISRLNNEADAARKRLAKLEAKYTEAFAAVDSVSIGLNERLLQIEQEIAEVRSAGVQDYLQQTAKKHSAALERLNAVQIDNAKVMERFSAYRRAVESAADAGTAEDSDSTLSKAKQKLNQLWARVHQLRGKRKEQTSSAVYETSK